MGLSCRSGQVSTCGPYSAPVRPNVEATALRAVGCCHLPNPPRRSGRSRVLPRSGDEQFQKLRPEAQKIIRQLLKGFDEALLYRLTDDEADLYNALRVRS